MRFGRLLTIINFSLLGAAIVVYLFAPPYIADLFLYILLAWMFGSIILFYLPISQRRVGSGNASPPTTTPVSAGPAGAGTVAPIRRDGAPLPSSTEPTDFGFCIYCGADLPGGAGACPACGKPVRRL